MSSNTHVAFLNQINTSGPKLNKFPLSNEVILTTDFGRITPFMCMEVVPGDIFRGRSELFTRLAPMKWPAFSRMDAKMHFFFIPYRLVFPGWETFFTGGVNGDGKDDDGVVQELPRISLLNSPVRNTIVERSLADYLGIPPLDGGTNPASPVTIQVMPFRSYQKVCDEWYRNQNLKDPYKFSTSGGSVSNDEFVNNLNVLRYKDWERDLFTAALPWTQRGDIAQFGGEVVLSIPEDAGSLDGNRYYNNDGTFVNTGNAAFNQISSGEGTVLQPTGQTAASSFLDPNGSLFSFTDVNEFRYAIRTQELFELYARSGARYYEVILGEYGVRSPDARLNRPEYIGGGSTPVQISEVLSTAQTDARVLGDFGGHAIVTGDNNRFKYRATEFGYIIGLLSYAPCSGYTQGIERHWHKSDRFDYLHPKLAHLGETPVFNAEVYALKDQTDPYGTFGYQPQYYEYRYITSRVAGHFRSSMSDWHLYRIFANPPSLNKAFVELTPDQTSRIFNVTDTQEDHLWCQIMNHVTVVRGLPLFGEPTI